MPNCLIHLFDLQDIVGFTSMSKEVEPWVVMKFLNDLFGSFDNVIEEYKVQKVGQRFMIVRKCISS